MLHNFTRYIDTEYRSIEAKESGLWRQIKYEWFTEMDNCAALAAAIADFMGWSECNLSQACAILREDLRPPTPRTVNETEYAYAQTFNVSVSTPLLDISSTRTYSFANYVYLSTLPVEKKMDSRQRWKTDTTLVVPKMVEAAHKRVPQNGTVAKRVAVSSHTTTSSRPLTREKFVHQKVYTRSGKRSPAV